MVNFLLAIDDEPGWLSIIRIAAESSGFQVHATTDAEAFRTVVTTGSPSVILLDLQMPDCDGVELLRFLSDQRCTATIVLMSGFDQRVLQITTTMGRELGLTMADPMQKPVRPADLRKLLDSLKVTHFDIDIQRVQDALEGNQLELYFQPLIGLGNRHLIGWEGLIRWQHPEHGLIMPDRFVSVAESSDLIGKFTDRVVELGVRQMGEWRRQGHRFFLSVNLSARNLSDPQLPDRLARLCAQNEVPCDLIRLELTETAAMRDPVLTLQILTRLRLKGFKLAIDDFGTGYSSLLQLYRLPFSEVKIDQSFVRQMENSEEANVIVSAIIGLAHALHLELIAEGIESEEVARRLTLAGCEHGQGYHFGRPMAAGKVEDWIANHSKLQ